MQIAIFDVDGVIFESPSSSTVTDALFWRDYWSDPAKQIPNLPMVRLAEAVVRAGWHVLFLTARPVEFTVHTITAMNRAGIFPVHVFVAGDLTGCWWTMSLMLCGGDLASGGWRDSGKWKISVINKLIMCGHSVQFMVEDYKPSADDIRTVVPVLLFERMRNTH